MRRTVAALSLSLACLLTACGGDAPRGLAPVAPDSADRIAAHVHFLADDLLEGRAAGTRGFDLAAHYVATRFRALGLEPAGEDGGWYQTVPMLIGNRLPDGARLAIERDGRRHEFAFQEDFLPGVDFDRAEAGVTAPLVFVGQAVHAPEFGHDDFAGVDLTGKIAVYLHGAPARFPNTARAFHSSAREKARAVAERGAVGAILLGDPEREARSPWARNARNWIMPAMRLRDADGRAVDTFPQLQVTAALSAAAAEALFAGAPQSAEDVFRRLQAGELVAFDLPGTATLASRSHVQPVESRNVVARLPGGDPALADEHVVLSAHLDHVGLGAPVDGDRIYNGALDNALGAAILLEAAELLAREGARPKRSLLFVALTAEEKGLLGAEHFARHPTVAGPLVANVNMDMPVILFPQDDAIPIGIEHSSLRAHVEAAAAELGMTLSADPMPEEVVFIRSDQYAFIRQGIPAVYMDGGIRSTDPAIDGAAVVAEFMRRHYHQPSDDLSLPIHWPSAARLARLNALIGRRIADDPQRPRWNEGDFFGERFAR